MQLEERTYYEEEQKMEANWILIFILATTITTLGIAVFSMYNEQRNWLAIGVVTSAILISDVLIVFLFKNMKLELALSRKGLHYKMKFTNRNNNVVNWSDVTAISIRKSPATGYGKKYKWRYGEVYAMNLKKGIELTLKNGKKKFFSLKDPDEFTRAFRKLELPLQMM